MAIVATSSVVVASDHRILVRAIFALVGEASGTTSTVLSYDDLLEGMAIDSPLRKLWETVRIPVETSPSTTANETVLFNPQIAVRMLPTLDAVETTQLIANVGFVAVDPTRPSLAIEATLTLPDVPAEATSASVYVEILKLVPTSI